MNANPILLQKKYARVVELFAKHNGFTLEKALDVFYHSELYKLMREGISALLPAPVPSIHHSCNAYQKCPHSSAYTAPNDRIHPMLSPK